MPSKPYQRTDSFPRRPEQHGRKNTFNLSHAHVSTFSMGRIIPFLIKETLPGDLFTISCEWFSRYARLYLPIMHYIGHTISWFYVTNRQLWPGEANNSWEYFINPYNTDSVGPPTVNIDVDTVLQLSDSLPEYMGVPTSTVAAVDSINTITISAFQMSAYLKCYDNFIRNDQITPERWFPLTSGNNTANFITALSAFMVPLFTNWNRDQFTSATPTPQVGANVLVPIMRTDSVDMLDPLWDYKGPTNWKKWSDDLPVTINDYLKTAGGDGHTEVDNTGGPVYLDIQETSASMRDFRFNVSLVEFLEASMRGGDKYPDMLEVMWDVNVDPLQLNRPKYIGGKRGRVVISEVMATATNSTDDTYVGDYSGQALSLDSTGRFRYYCMEHGFILGLITVTPQTQYFQGLDRMWTRTDKYDYAWEQFALIGDDAIKGKEVFFQFRSAAPFQEYNDTPWGYQRRYYEYTYANDVLAGQMRDTLLSFTMARAFVADGIEANLPQLNDDFIVASPDIARVFQVNAEEGEHEIYSYMYNEVFVERRLPKFGIPIL